MPSYLCIAETFGGLPTNAVKVSVHVFALTDLEDNNFTDESKWRRVLHAHYQGLIDPMILLHIIYKIFK